MNSKSIYKMAIGFILSVVFYNTCLADNTLDSINPCKNDTNQYCANVPKNTGALPKCLEENLDKLSENCRTLIERRKLVLGGCQNDLAKLCSSAQGAEITRCLLDHQSELSPNCLKTMKKN